MFMFLLIMPHRLWVVSISFPVVAYPFTFPFFDTEVSWRKYDTILSFPDSAERLSNSSVCLCERIMFYAPVVYPRFHLRWGTENCREAKNSLKLHQENRTHPFLLRTISSRLPGLPQTWLWHICTCVNYNCLRLIHTLCSVSQMCSYGSGPELLQSQLIH